MEEEAKNSSKENQPRKYAITSKTDKKLKASKTKKKIGAIFKEFSIKYLIVSLLILALLRRNYSYSNVNLSNERKDNIINHTKKMNLNLRKLVSGEDAAECSSNFPFKNLTSGECIKECDINSLVQNLCELSYKDSNVLYNTFKKDITNFDIRLFNMRTSLELMEKYFSFTIINLEYLKEPISNYYFIKQCLFLLEQNSGFYNSLDDKKVIALMINHYNEYNQINKTIYEYYSSSEYSSPLSKINSSICDSIDYINNTYDDEIFVRINLIEKTSPYNENNLCLDTNPEGYYLDSEDSSCKKCFATCKYCYGYGNDINNNCSECIANYSFLNSSTIKNCYKECPHYFYYDDKKGISYCTENETCPEEFNKLIFEKKKCVKNCDDDDTYKYLFQKRCYEECPQDSFKSENNSDYSCKQSCPKDYPFEIILTQECVKYCPINYYIKNLCILSYKSQELHDNENKNEIYDEEIRMQDLILKNFEASFTSEDYDTSNLDKGEDEVFENEKMKITLTTTKNQMNNMNNKNMTIIDLDECETMLRAKYNLNEDDILYMKKIDINQEGMKIPKVEYDVYSKLSGNHLIKLNLSICEGTKISLLIPTEITEDLDKMNRSSGYYNDICYTATSENGTDISLEDRKKNISMVIKWYVKMIVTFQNIMKIYKK